MIRKAVGAIIVDENDSYLLVHKVKIKDGKIVKIMDAWDFVKGGIKEGESPRQAIVRELWEETGHENYKIEKEYGEKISFDFPNFMSEINGYESQETTMFLVKYSGNKHSLNAIDDEIDEVIFFEKRVILEKLNTRETKEFWNKYLDNSLI